MHKDLTSEGEAEITDEMRLAFLKGAYDMCGLLLTSPRMNRPQRELITDQAMSVKAQMEGLGATFTDRTAPLQQSSKGEN